jgi:aspartate/methionine/tyrosine aminotransferase
MRDPARMQAVQSPIIPVVAEWIRSCPGTISLGQGVVSYGPPPGAAARIAEFLKEPDNNKYKPVIGIAPLIDAIAEKLTAENKIRLSSSNAIVVTAGGNMAFMNAILAITDPGDEVIIQTPYYFNHEMAVTMAGCHPVPVNTNDEYQLRPDAIAAAITPRTRAIVTISPNNPTGAVYPESALREINRFCADGGIYHIHDEAYENFLYNQAKHFSPASIPGAEAHTISLYSFSKAYGFASWRIGYMLIPQRLLDSVRKIQDTIVICPPVISQYAAVGALQTGSLYCQDHLRHIEEVRAVVLRELETIKHICTVPRADGAFYFLLRIHKPLDPLTLTERLIREHGVAVIPGTAFGIRSCYLRVAYGALQKDTAAEGIGRLVRGLKSLAS